MAELNKAALAGALNSVSKALPSKSSTISVINGVFFEGDGETITLTATDLEWTCQARLQQPHIDTFSAVLPSESIGAISSIPGDTLELYVASDLSATFSAGKSRYMFRGISGEDFPRLKPPGGAACALTLSGTALKSALLKVLPAASRDDSRPVFRGIQFAVKDGTLTLNASDTYRVAQATVPVPKSEGSGMFLIPAEILSAIAKILPASSDVQVEFEAKSVGFRAKDKDKELACNARLLDDKFPDIDRVLPVEFTSETTVNVGEALSAISRAGSIADNATLTLKTGPGEMNITAVSEKGRAEETVTVADQNGEPLDVCLNGKFLADGLKAISGATCTISWSGKMLAIKDGSDSGFRYVLLPIKK
jgi:DNA polymerase-3 subunit beta